MLARLTGSTRSWRMLGCLVIGVQMIECVAGNLENFWWKFLYFQIVSRRASTKTFTSIGGAVNA